MTQREWECEKQGRTVRRGRLSFPRRAAGDMRRRNAEGKGKSVKSTIIDMVFIQTHEWGGGLGGA